MEANKGRSIKKPDGAVKVITTAIEQDNASDMLASCRYRLSLEIVEPSVYWHKVTTK